MSTKDSCSSNGISGGGGSIRVVGLANTVERQAGKKLSPNTFFCLCCHQNSFAYISMYLGWGVSSKKSFTGVSTGLVLIESRSSNVD